MCSTVLLSVGIQFVSHCYHKLHSWECSGVCVRVSPGHISQNGIAGLQAVHIFNGIKYCQIAPQNDCTKLHSL